MRSGGGRAKGNGFERVVSKLILKYAGSEFTAEDCFRTPLSGGHRFARKKDPGDLQLSPALLKAFPAIVECKRYRDVNLEHFLVHKKKSSWQELQWLNQVIDQAMGGHDLMPVLVMQANRGAILCVTPAGDGHDEADDGKLVFHYRGTTWILCEFETFMENWFDAD